MEATSTCPYCGEPVSLWIDEGGGESQDYVEDCSVCCRPWRVRATLGEDGAQVAAVAGEGAGEICGGDEPKARREILGRRGQRAERALQVAGQLARTVEPAVGIEHPGLRDGAIAGRDAREQRDDVVIPDD